MCLNFLKREEVYAKDAQETKEKYGLTDKETLF